MRLFDWLKENNLLIYEFSKKTNIHRHRLWDILTGNSIASLEEAIIIQNATDGEITIEHLWLKSQKNPHRKS